MNICATVQLDARLIDAEAAAFHNSVLQFFYVLFPDCTYNSVFQVCPALPS